MAQEMAIGQDFGKGDKVIMYFITCRVLRLHKGEYMQTINNKIIDIHPVEFLMKNKDHEIVLLFWEKVNATKDYQKEFNEAAFTLFPNG